MEKVQKAAAIRGPTYIHCHSPCPTGWGLETKDVIEVGRLAVKSGAVVLYEIENGVRRLTKPIGKRVPVEQYLRTQGRFKHLWNDPAGIQRIQDAVDTAFDATIASMT